MLAVGVFHIIYSVLLLMGQWQEAMRGTGLESSIIVMILKSLLGISVALAQNLQSVSEKLCIAAAGRGGGARSSPGHVLEAWLVLIDRQQMPDMCRWEARALWQSSSCLPGAKLHWCAMQFLHCVRKFLVLEAVLSGFHGDYLPPLDPSLLSPEVSLCFQVFLSPKEEGLCCWAEA